MKTDRGFEIIHFDDDYGVDCTLQESSSVEPHIWLGVHNPEVCIRFKDAIANGLDLEKKFPETNENGWCDFPIPDEALIKSRMHLNQEQAKLLADRLNFFAEHGYLNTGEE